MTKHVDPENKARQAGTEIEVIAAERGALLLAIREAILEEISDFYQEACPGWLAGLIAEQAIDRAMVTPSAGHTRDRTEP